MVTSRMLEQLTYVQIAERLNISSGGARAMVKRNRLPRAHDKHGKTLVAIDLDELQHKPLPVWLPRRQPVKMWLPHSRRGSSNSKLPEADVGLIV